jgi:hypothetical protein
MDGAVLGCTAATLVALVVGMAFGIALGLRWAEPRYKDPQLHGGDWGFVGMTGTVVMWRRKEPRRKNCHDEHRAFICTIVHNTSHVDACDCGKTRQGVYGQWL